jgi:hypothetical protein
MVSKGKTTSFLRPAHLLTNPLQEKNVWSNGWRYLQVGGTRKRLENGKLLRR